MAEAEFGIEHVEPARATPHLRQGVRECMKPCNPAPVSSNGARSLSVLAAADRRPIWS
jgi:hypothetical protein